MHTCVCKHMCISLKKCRTEQVTCFRYSKKNRVCLDARGKCRNHIEVLRQKTDTLKNDLLLMFQKSTSLLGCQKQVFINDNGVFRQTQA
jgi:hypothetical protein